MNKRTLALAAGALLFTGGTTVYASSSNPEEGNQNERENIENYHDERKQSHAEFEDDYYNSNYGMMRSKRDNNFRSHCGFRR